MKNFRWRFSCIILCIIQLDTMWAFLARFFFQAFSAFLFCRISCAFFNSGSLVLVRSGVLTNQLHTICVYTSPGNLVVVLALPSGFFM